MTNNRAIEADRVYLANEGAINFHTLSRIHNFHLKIYASLFLGQYKSAMERPTEIDRDHAGRIAAYRETRPWPTGWKPISA